MDANSLQGNEDFIGEFRNEWHWLDFESGKQQDPQQESAQRVTDERVAALKEQIARSIAREQIEQSTTNMQGKIRDSGLISSTFAPDKPVSIPPFNQTSDDAANYGTKAIADAALVPLEIWKNAHLYEYSVHLELPEFTALCPRSGYPDFGKIVIDYVPGDHVCELKAIKLYINSFRDKRISHENVVNAIANKFERDVNPISLRVIGDFVRRGGVKTVIEVKRGSIREFPAYTPELL